MDTRHRKFHLALCHLSVLAVAIICIGYSVAALAIADPEPPTRNLSMIDWVEPLGQWTPTGAPFSGSTYESVQSVPTAIAVATAYSYEFPSGPNGPDVGQPTYTYKVRALNRRAHEVALIGVVWAYQDTANYYEAVFSPTGSAVLRWIKNGVLTTVASANYSEGGKDVWIDISLTVDDHRATIRVNHQPVFSDVILSGIDNGTGSVGLITHATTARFTDLQMHTPVGDQPFEERFSDAQLEGWSAQSAGWVVNDGMYVNSMVERTSITLAPIYADFYGTMYFTVKARMFNPYGASGNLVGLVFNHQSPQDYSEVVFSPTGTASINRISGGRMQTLATAAYSGLRNQWFDVKLLVTPSTIAVQVDDDLVFENIAANPEGYARGAVGLITHWAPGKFDDVAFHHGIVSPLSDTFAPDAPFQWDTPIGSWNTDGGTLNSTSVGPADFALNTYADFDTNFVYRARLLNRYGASGNLVGLLYNAAFSTATETADRYEVLFSPTGIAYMDKIVEGTRYRVATGAHPARRNEWFDVEILRRGIYTTVKVNGAVIFDEVPQGQLGPSTARRGVDYPGPGYIGVITRWSRGAFDDISVEDYFPRSTQ